MEPWKDSCCSRREASAELGDQDRRHWTCELIVWLKHCFSLETFLHKFVAFFVPLGIVIFCIGKMSFLCSFSKTEFTPAIISLSTYQELDNVH